MLRGGTVPGVEALSRRTLRGEVLLVLGVSLGASAVSAFLSLIDSLTTPKPLNQQTQTLVPSVTPDRPWLDLAFQLYNIGAAVIPALLAVHLLRRDHDNPAVALGLAPARPRFDLATGAGLAALIGIPGIGLYIGARAAGFNVTVVPGALPHVWWQVPVLLLVAAQNAVLGEGAVVGYLRTRLRQPGWGASARSVVTVVFAGSHKQCPGF